jgi:hypothetical protein
LSIRKPFDLKYVAGIVDGEGCVRISLNKAAIQANKRPRVTMALTVSNTYKPLLYKLKRQFGGTIHHVNHASIKHKDSYNWVLSERAACLLLKKLLPFMFIKKKQAKLAIRLLALKDKLRRTKKGRPQGAPLTDEEYEQRLVIVQESKALNHRGKLVAA